MQLDFLLSPERSQALRAGPILVSEQAALFEVNGPGALDCLQGLVTHDLAAAGERSLTYGAMLTNKGMIVLDPFVLRTDPGFVLVLPRFAREIATAHFHRVLPPRLAQVQDRSDEWAVLWLLGSRSGHLLDRELGARPGEGRITPVEPSGPWLACATPVMPFAALLVGEIEPLSRIRDRLQAPGTVSRDEATLAAARVLAGWPSLGREIDERTLPQEVRYDELGAVSYAKGCYTGQETVARVHFRGHPNRLLRGVMMTPAGFLQDRSMYLGDKEVGVLRTTITTGDRTIALATVRREVQPDDLLRASGGMEARLVEFPVGQEAGV